MTGIASWRVKETDRIAAMATELAKLGARVEAGRRPPDRAPAGSACVPATIDTYDDHRMAMCFSLATLGGIAVRINDPDACARRSRGTSTRFARSPGWRPCERGAGAGDCGRRPGGVGQGDGGAGRGALRSLPPARQRLALPPRGAQGAGRARSTRTTSPALAAVADGARRRLPRRPHPARGPGRDRRHPRRGRQRRRVARCRPPGGARGAAGTPAGVPASRPGSSPTAATWGPWSFPDAVLKVFVTASAGGAGTPPA